MEKSPSSRNLKAIQFADNAFFRPVPSRSRVRFKALKVGAANSRSISLALGPDKTPLSLALACSVALNAILKPRGYNAVSVYLSRAAKYLVQRDYCTILFTPSCIVQNCPVMMLSTMLSTCANKLLFALR